MGISIIYNEVSQYANLYFYPSEGSNPADYTLSFGKRNIKLSYQEGQSLLNSEKLILRRGDEVRLA